MKKGNEKRRKITLKKRERKKEENYIKKGEKGLKNASFWASPRPPQTYLSGEKMNLKKGVGEKIIKMHNIYPCITNFNLAKTFKLGTLPVVVLSRPPKLIHISLKHSLLFAA